MKNLTEIKFREFIPYLALVLYCWFAQPVFRFIFSDLLFENVLIKFRPGNMILFLFAYTILMVLANIVSLKMMDHAIPYLSRKNVLSKYCPSMKHLMFYTQLISLALIEIVPRYFLCSNLYFRAHALAVHGIPVLLGLSVFAYLASILPSEGIIPLWVELSVVYFGVIQHRYSFLPLDIMITLIAMNVLPIQKLIADNWTSILEFLRLLVSPPGTDPFDYYDDEEDDDDDLPFR